MLALPGEILIYTGQPYTVERPAQGMNFEVYILSTARGRFVLKIGGTPDKVAELENESRILDKLRREHPFVAQPIGHVVQNDVGMFLFTCIEGENMLDALARADSAGRHHLIAQFARSLRRIHDWEPPFPRPDDWLGESLRRAEQNVATGAVANPIQHRGQFGGVDPRALLEEMVCRPAHFEHDLVFGHGDYCLPNALVRDNTIAGVVDWSAGGYADRRFDLAMAGWSIMHHNLRDTEYRDTFLRTYAYAEPAGTLRYFEALYVLV